MGARNDYQDMAAVLDKYNTERDKRLGAKGLDQYFELRTSTKFKHIYEDPGVEVGTPVLEPVADGGHCRVLIVGAGFSGLQFAVQLIKTGEFKAEDFVMVDPAGGFGGTWWWNRYPGLMCDIESYIFLPFLEDTGYIPKKKYSMGYEIREYCDLVADRWGLRPRAMFQSSAKSHDWDAMTKSWISKIVEEPKGQPGSKHEITIRSDFVILNTGVLNNPKLPSIPGIEDFKGHMFHTARWDWKFTGGEERECQMTGLKGKRVALVGTGATCIQALPHLAKHAAEVYVFQRTPSAVDTRGQRDTDPEEFKTQVANKPGWWKARCANFQDFVTDLQPLPEVDLVNDQWTKARSYSALQGGMKGVTLFTVGKHIRRLHEIDAPRQARIRKRTEEVVKDQETAKSLQAWYPTWCKRPTFHDDYLEAYNIPTVHLVDTDGRTIDAVTPDGINFQDKEYPVDVIIWSTGFVSPAVGSPAARGGIDVRGIDGQSLNECYEKRRWRTLHGFTLIGFPNMFWAGLTQGGAGANHQYTLHVLAEHVVWVMATACQRVRRDAKMAGSIDGLDSRKKKISTATTAASTTHNGNTTRALEADVHPIIQPESKAARKWARLMVRHALGFAALQGCTPSYLNREGETERPSSLLQKYEMAKMAAWSEGFNSFAAFLAAWRAQGDGMKGLLITRA